jgi:hypothetical protein
MAAGPGHHFQSREVHHGTGLVNLNTHAPILSIEVENSPRGHFLRLCAYAIPERHVQHIRVYIIVNHDVPRQVPDVEPEVSAQRAEP